MLLFYPDLPRTGTSLSACSGTWPARRRRMLSTKRSDTARRRISLRPAAPPYGASAIRWADPAAGCPAAAAPARTHPGRRRRCGGSARPRLVRTGGDVHIVVAGAGLDHRQPRRPAQKGIVHPDVLRDHHVRIPQLSLGLRRGPRKNRPVRRKAPDDPLLGRRRKRADHNHFHAQSSRSLPIPLDLFRERKALRGGPVRWGGKNFSLTLCSRHIVLGAEMDYDGASKIIQREREAHG